jgi:hypothetical protein
MLSANNDFADSKMAPAVGFEPTTNRLTADRSTTELRWISQLKKPRAAIFAHDWIEATANKINPSTTYNHFAIFCGLF